MCIPIRPTPMKPSCLSGISSSALLLRERYQEEAAPERVVDGTALRARSAAMNENLTTERPTFVTHLECSMTGERYEADTLHNLSKAGKPLLVRYDLRGVKKALTKNALKQRPDGLWKWRELLP